MNAHADRSRVGRRPLSVAVIAAACLASIAAACGSSPGRPSAQADGWLAFSRCMRSDGVSNYPDPDSSGKPPKKTLQQLGVSNSRFRAAQSACGHLLPNGGLPPNQAEQQRVAVQAVRYSRCVREHGVPSFPDPDSTGRIPDPATVGIDQGSPKFQAANQACGRYRPPYMPSNTAYDTWARTHRGS